MMTGTIRPATAKKTTARTRAAASTKNTPARRSRGNRTHPPRHQNNRVRLSKGANHKEHPKAWEYILVEYEIRPGVEVENLQQVRAVYDQAKER